MKRIAILALCLCMVITMFPMTALATGTAAVKYINATKDGSDNWTFEFADVKGDSTIAVFINGAADDIYITVATDAGLSLLINNDAAVTVSESGVPEEFRLSGTAQIILPTYTVTAGNCPAFTGDALNIDDVVGFYTSAHYKDTDKTSAAAVYSYTVTGDTELADFLTAYNLTVQFGKTLTINAPSGPDAPHHYKLTVTNALNVSGTLTAAEGQKLEIGQNATVTGIGLNLYYSDGIHKYTLPATHDTLEFTSTNTGTVESPVYRWICDTVVPTYTITASAGDYGTITATATVAQGDSEDFTATAGSGYVIDKLTVDGSAVQDAANKSTYTYTFSNVEANHSVNVTFKEDTYSAPTEAIKAHHSAYHTPPPVASDPVTDDTVTTVTIDVNPSVSGTIASAVLFASDVDSAVSSALNTAERFGTSPVIEITVNVPAQANSLAVTIPSAAMKTLGGKEDAALILSSGIGTITLDEASLSGIAKQAGNSVTISLAPVDASKLNEYQKEVVGDAPVYDISITSGKTTISDLSGGQATVSVPYTLAEGQDASGIVVYYLGDDGNIHKCETTYDPATKTVSFVTNHFSKYVVGYDALAAWVNSFTDIKESDWFYDDVAYAKLTGLMKGTSVTTFNPHGMTTRGMIVEILYRLENKPAVTDVCPFGDVASGKYYEKAVTWAAANKIVAGYGDGKFGPEDPITREQMAAILYRYEQYNGGGFTGAWMFPLNFSDVNKVSDWAYEAVCWCTMNGIINGNSDGTLAPQGKAERCQMAAILHRFCENVK